MRIFAMNTQNNVESLSLKKSSDDYSNQKLDNISNEEFNEILDVFSLLLKWSGEIDHGDYEGQNCET